jgi:hypothetical protein
MSAAASLRPSAIPPAAATGVSGAASTTAGTKGNVLREMPDRQSNASAGVTDKDDQVSHVAGDARRGEVKKVKRTEPETSAAKEPLSEYVTTSHDTRNGGRHGVTNASRR